MKNESVQAALKNSLKREITRNEWWTEVQEDVRTRLNWVVNNIESLGTMFVRSYMVLFRWEFERRNVDGERISNPMAGYLATLLGMKISEETYQCGILPTRAILDLYDYVSPNDADVAACLFLCHKIELLEKMGVLVHNDSDMKTTPSEMAKALKSIKPPIQNPGDDAISWDFDEETDPSNN